MNAAPEFNQDDNSSVNQKPGGFTSAGSSAVKPSSENASHFDSGNSTNGKDTNKSPVKPTYSTLHYPASNLEFGDLPAYLAQVRNSSGTDWYNGPVDRGVVVSPYFTAKVNGKSYPVYGTRATTGLHSFVYVDVTNPDDQSISISVEVTLTNFSAEKCTVIPESTGVKASFSGKKATAMFRETGYFTLIFDENPDHPVTFIVREKEEFQEVQGKTVLHFKPDTYEVLQVPANSIAYFEVGSYEIYDITMSADSQIYFEDGTYIQAIRKSGGGGLIHGWGATNAKIYGHALIDMSRQDASTYCCINFARSDNFTLSGLTFINSSSWTVPICQSYNVHIYDLVMLGYRVFSDGVTIADCEDSIVENCFARTGDDAFNVKSMLLRSDALPVDNTNIRIRNCQAWAEKAKGFGVIWETVRDIHDIWFEDCAVLFYQSSWQENLGAMVVTSAEPTNIYNIHFDNIEIYHTDFWPICIYGEKANTTIRDIYFNHIKMNTNQNILISNKNGGNISTIYFDNIYNNGKKITTLSGLKLKFGGSCSNSNVRLNTK